LEFDHKSRRCQAIKEAFADRATVAKGHYVGRTTNHENGHGETADGRVGQTIHQWDCGGMLRDRAHDVVLTSCGGL
jgi:hypothetical protein